ncbi:MAG: helical backbone metal receptor [Gammaproteobacteria bacterium]|nr:helical backbone metal receptor [Gammaproteobacteria bacterium]
MIALNPDLVVAWESAKNRDAMRTIERLGFAVYYSEPRDFEDIIENIRELAQLTGSVSSIDPPVAALRAELDRVRARFAAAATQRVFYQVWSNPLITLGGRHFISRVLEVCGARNIFADSTILAPRVSIETVVRADPDIIISGRVHGRAPADISMWEKWPTLRAVAGDGLVFVDSDVMHRHTARMIMGIGEVCEEIDRVRRGNSSTAAADE